MQSPKELGFRMPGEWTNHQCCWMVWPTAHAQWDDIKSVEQAYADVANAIAQFEPVRMVVNPGESSRVNAFLGNNVTLHELPNDDSWMRDIGPSFIKHQTTEEVAGTSWRFNCWGGYSPYYLNDAQVASRMLDQLNMSTYEASLVLEGGAIHVDGKGTLVTTESVVLNPNRNWGMNKKQAEVELCNATGAEKIIWLPGDPDGETGDMTDGHIDGIMCFVKPGVVMFEQDISENGEFARLERENRRALELATDGQGRKMEIIDLKIDHCDIGQDAELFCSSYINFYLPNGGVVMPSYGVSSDQLVFDFLSQIYTDRKVAMVDINAIAPGGGGIHCITQQQPT